jgi:hypothetical protein
MPGPLRWSLVALAALLSRQALAQTRVVYLWYADGGPLPVNTTCAAAPPAYRCDFAPTPEGCKREILRYLDAWYADLDLVFTHSKPPGDYDTVVITTDGAWCGAGPQNLGRGQLGPQCQTLPTGYAIAYQCGTDAKRCATIIAQEQAHLVGLEHTVSEHDVMNVNFFTTHDGFEDAVNPVINPECQREQNSYLKMKERLGPWVGGLKPGPYDREVDGGADAAPDGADAPGNADAAAGGGPADAPAADATHDGPADRADGGPSAGDPDGCGCALGDRPGPVRWPALALAALALLRLRPGRRFTASCPGRR